MGYQEAYDKLKKYGQLHVLQYYEELSDAQKEALLAQIMDTDLSVLEQCRHKEELNPRGEITPIEVMKLSRIEERREEFVRTGLDAIRAGRVGAVMLAGGMGTRLELRCPDPSANPYLALAVCLRAGLDGIRNKILPPESVDRDVFGMSVQERCEKGIAEMPGTLIEAVHWMETDDIIKDVLGSHVLEKYIAAKKEEWNRYRCQVTDWEINEYLNTY